MNILLVYPEFPATFWSFKHALRFIGKKSSFPPLGLLTVAAMLPKAWDVRLVDLNIRHLPDKELAWADIVMLSGMGVQKASALEVIRRAQAMGKRTVGGGPLFTCEPEAFAHVDHLVLNEAEHTLQPFLDDLAAGRAKARYTSTTYPTLAETPIPRWDLIRLRSYASMSIQYSRGCPFNCDFCNVTALFGHKPRTKSAAQIIAELDALYQRGWRDSVFFVDDNFIGHKRHLLKELLPALIAWRRGKKGLPFYTEASINLADDSSLMHMLHQAGFDTVFIGLETPSEEGLAECNKVQNRGRDLVSCIKTIQQHGLQVQGGFIVGFDTDTASIFQRQIDFIQKSGVVMAMVGILQAPPGTALYARMKSEGRLLGESSGNNVDSATNIIPRMDIEHLVEGYRQLFKNLYTPKHYYARLQTFLREYRAPLIRSPLSPIKLRAFLRANIRLGIIGRERYQYWKLLAWVCLRKRQLLPVAISLAITGHHFRRISATL